ncbi:SMC-Scp complex subunit ScpB [Amycolatopsis arida]|uniref:SMC-Scp complex subunit ScpB n=1 Tax=Amycolatopsis arida TaxID=587909 RepID=UPI003C7A5FBF
MRDAGTARPEVGEAPAPPVPDRGERREPAAPDVAPTSGLGGLAALDVDAPDEDGATGDEAIGDEAIGEDDQENQDDLVAVDTEGSRPDLTRDAALRSALEALLLVVDSPASEESLAGALDQPVDRVTEMLRTMAEDLNDQGSGIDLRRVGEGWRFFTRDTYAPFVEKLLLDGQRSKLTRAALETLAVIAYRQPVTRSRVAAVRGVNVDGVIRTLLARGLIEEAGSDPETGGTLYVTTELFLERLGLSSLNDLPPIAPLLPEVDSIDDI